MSAASFLTRFEREVDRRPAAPAVTFEGVSLSYGALEERANRLARHLVRRGVCADGVVAICSERSPELVIALLAALKAGAGYLPLDAKYPADRLRFMLEDSRASFLIRQRGLVVDLPLDGPPELEIAADHPVLLEGDGSRLLATHIPDGLVYAIYTSGSTGKPKGVAMVHRALDNLIDWQLSDSIAGETSTTLQFAPISFDVHFQEIFSTWCSGGRLVLVREDVRLQMLALLDLIDEEKVERVFLPFIALQSLADIAVAHDRIPASLREVITAGEQLQITRSVRELFARLPHTRLYNHYGPSETHVVTSLRLADDPSSWPALPPIGFALPNVSLEIVKEDGATAAPGEEGELFVGGVALARGYLFRPELTGERFVMRGGSRFYRTGDLVSTLPGGALQFLGRLDGQVKVRGYRIELGEVEVALTAHPSVREAAVLVHERRPGDKRLIAYLVLEPNAEIASIRALVEQRLPDYMAPSTYVPLAALPRTPSGKVDKRALPLPTRARPALGSEVILPSTDLERSLAAIWSDILDIETIGVRDGFFELGGNSLLAMRALAETQRRARKAIPIARFFDHPTIAEQAAYLTDPTSLDGGVRRMAEAGADAKAPIAIIGMAGRFPGARSIAELWTHLRDGVDSIEVFPNNDVGVPEAERADPTYVGARGILADADRFDAAFFGVSRNEAEVLDPQQRVLLELSWSALEHAGHAPGSLRAVVGVYAGVHNNSYYARAVSMRPDAVERVGDFVTMIATEKDYVATRIANKLDLTGPALSIHTACSTSLVAIATAVSQLRAGFCEMALAGGASITVPQRRGHLYQEGGMLSRDGHTRSFDAEATGTVFSDGAGMVVLKPLDRAIRDGDTVYAVIRGVGLNNDGGHKASFTAPSVEGQAAAILLAQRDAGVSPQEIQYVEAHGTATPIGDVIELEALAAAFARGGKGPRRCGIGSIKSNIGHLTAAAGVAGLIKVVLSLVNEEWAPTAHFRRPNPKIAFETGPFFVVAERTPWPRSAIPRLAGISSFGVGGTNAHAVVGEAPLLGPSGPSIAKQVLVISAKTREACDRACAALADHLDTASDTNAFLADAAYTLALGRAHFAERRAVVATSAKEAARELRKSGAGAAARATSPPPKVAFLFPGQGAQYVDMGRNLYESEALFRATVDECAELLLPKLRRDLRSVLYPEAAARAEAADELKRTAITQAALFTIEYALARTLIAWGVKPSLLAGHSVGEFVAACLSGVFPLEDALGLVAARGQIMQEMPAGAMLSVRASASRVLDLLSAELDVAADNGPGLCVVSGSIGAIDRFAAKLEGLGVASKRLETSHAYHSRSMDTAVPRFAEAVRRVRLARPELPIVSTATGTWLTDAQALDADYWADHLRQPVRFTSAVATLASDPGTILLEVGPRKTLTTLAAQREPGDPRPRPLALACLADRADGDAEWSSLLATLGRLWTLGVEVDFRAFFRGEKRRRIGVPGYSFERDRFWLDPPALAPVGADEVLLISPSAKRAATAISEFEVTVMQSTKPASAAPSRRERLVHQLKQLFEQASGSEFGDANPTAHFLELGVDSLLMTQLALRLKQTFRVPITFRQIMEDTPSFNTLAEYLDAHLPADAEPAKVAQPAPAPLAAATPGPPAPAAFVPTPGQMGALGLTQQLLQLQMAQLALLQQQLALAAPPSMPTALAPAAVAPAPAPSAAPETDPVRPAADREVSPNGVPAAGQASYDPAKAFGAIARIYRQSDAMSPQQQGRLQHLVDRYCAKTKSSKAHTQQYRAQHADPRVVNGFKPRIKELIYPIVTSRASGCRLWDLDGNEYIDALNGFGSNFFGYSAKIIADALHDRIDRGFEIGPQTTLAGESAAMVCELTGMDRAAFCNTGSEAVMGALRIARTVTGRSLVVAFSGSYHGIFDEVIVRDTKTMRSVPAAPGILPESVQNILVLEYGTDKTLAVIRERADEIAAVLVEPVQSRRPEFRPKAFLHEVRKITRASQSALIFDEVITGFRVHPGGAQAYYEVEADLATYGKVVGGGMPIGVIAGRNPWMDALDGGQWQYGDDSAPTAGVTYFAGTFVRHPLAMAAAHAALRYMKAEGPALQERLTAATTRMADELNAFFREVGAPTEIRHFASLWKTFFLEPQPYGELLFCYLRDRGVHIWDGFPCFLTLAHGEAEIAFIVDAFKAAVREMQAGDFLPGGTHARRSFDADNPPLPGARLGRDADGNPAWFVPNPEIHGKYLKLS